MTDKTMIARAIYSAVKEKDLETLNETLAPVSHGTTPAKRQEGDAVAESSPHLKIAEISAPLQFFE